jgi:hypothetical protein
MEWADDLRKFRESIETMQRRPAESREFSEKELQERLSRVQEAFEDLKPEAYLDDMNRILLDGRGEVELYLPWGGDDEGEDDDEDDEDEDEMYELELEGDEDDDDEDDDDDDAEEDEEQEVASAILVWNGGECELAIDVGLEDDRIYWQVNGDDVPTDDGALRESLKRAFAEEIGL